MAWIRNYKTKQGERYQVVWRDQTGKRSYGEPQPYKSKANELRKEKELELANDSSGMVLNIPTKITIQQVFDIFHSTYKERVTEERSVGIMRGSMNPFLATFGEFQIQSISSIQLERFKNSLLQTRVSNGINFVIRYFKIFFNFAVKNGYIKSDPSKVVKQFPKKKVAKFLTREELCRLYLASPKKLRRVIFSMVYTGLRIGEFVNLKIEDILDNAIEVKDKSGNKTGGPFIPISPKVRKIVQTAVETYQISGFEIAFRKAVKKINMGRIRAHDLRHTFASVYLQSGGTTRDLQIILGHKSMAMMEVYAHFQRSYLEERMSAVRFPKPYKKSSKILLKVA